MDRGARWREEAGWKVPGSFGDLLAEHGAVRRTAGVVDLSSRGTLRVRGAERLGFLHRLLSADLHEVAAPGWTPSLLLNPKGKVVADMRVIILGDSILLDVAPENPGTVAEKLRRVILASDVEIEDETSRTAILSVHGPEAPKFIPRVLGEGRSLPGPREVAEIDPGGTGPLILRSALTGEEGFDILFPVQGAAALWEALNEENRPVPVGLDALEILRVEAGVPRFGADFGEDTIPLEAGLEEAISLEKGCFLGQEVVARATHRGGVRRRIYGLIIDADSPPPPKSPVFKEEVEVGWVSSAALPPGAGRVLALAYVRCDQVDSPEGFHVRTNGESHAARLADLPFYRRDA